MIETFRWSRLFALVALIGALALFAACGGGDDDDDDDAGPGGDGGSDSGGSGNSDADPSGSEEKYVGTICEASLKFTKALEKIKPEDVTDEEKIFDVLKGPYEDFVKGVEKAKPPKELKTYHDEAVKQLKVGLKAIQDEDIAGIAAIGDAQFPDPPADVKARLEKAAQENKDCTEAGVTFD